MNLLAGATGFLGSEILKELENNKSETLVLSRRNITNLPNNAEELIIDFDNLAELELPKIGHVFLSLGHPLYYHNVMGLMSNSLKNDFYLVDFTYQLEIAKKAKKAGASSICLISAVGANSKSNNFYLKTKGLLEEEIIKLGFESTNIFQPGHLRGNKLRIDIIFADLISIILDPFLIRSFKKFKSISVKNVAKCVVGSCKDTKIGTHKFKFPEFIEEISID